MASGAKSKFGAPTIETEFFQKQICCIEESTCDIVGTFRRLLQQFVAPQWFGAQRIVPPLSPLVTPLIKNNYKLGPWGNFGRTHGRRLV